jgi:hypothetical protein
MNGFMNFLGSFALNLLLNIWGGLISAMLLMLHLKLGLPIWCFWTFLGCWLFGVAARTLFLHWVASQPDVPERPRINKNPYSQKGYKPVDTNR